MKVYFSTSPSNTFPIQKPVKLFASKIRSPEPSGDVLSALATRALHSAPVTAAPCPFPHSHPLSGLLITQPSMHSSSLP